MMFSRLDILNAFLAYWYFQLNVGLLGYNLTISVSQGKSFLANCIWISVSCIGLDKLTFWLSIDVSSIEKIFS